MKNDSQYFFVALPLRLLAWGWLWFEGPALALFLDVPTRLGLGIPVPTERLRLAADLSEGIPEARYAFWLALLGLVLPTFGFFALPRALV